MAKISFNNDVKNFLNALGFTVDVAANRPATSYKGTFYVATDTPAIYWWNGAAWITISSGSGGGVTSADNGLRLNGTVAELDNGSNPLSSDVAIVLGTHNFTINGTTVAFGGTITLKTTAAGVQSSFAVAGPANTWQTTDGTNQGVSFTQGNTVITMGYHNAAANRRQLTIGATGNNIQFTDEISNIGPQKDASITVAAQLATPTAYATVDLLGGALVGTINLANQTTSQTVTLYTVSISKNQLLRINPMIFFTTIGGAPVVNFSLNYTDQGSNAQSIALGGFTLPNVPPIASYTVYAKSGTNITLTVSFSSGTPNYFLYATCEYLGLQN